MQTGNAARFGKTVDPVVEVYKKDVDKTLLVETLKLTVQQRIDRLEEFAHEIETLRAGLKK
jgi:hypothetical protein